MTMMATQEPTDPSVLINNNSSHSNDSVNPTTMTASSTTATTNLSNTASSSSSSSSLTMISSNPTAPTNDTDDTEKNHSSPSQHQVPAPSTLRSDHRTCNGTTTSTTSGTTNSCTTTPTNTVCTTTAATTTTTTTLATRTPPRSSLANDPNLTPIASIKRPRANMMPTTTTTTTTNNNMTTSLSTASANRSTTRTPQKSQSSSLAQVQPMLMSPGANTNTATTTTTSPMTLRYSTVLDDTTPLSPMHKIKPVLHREVAVVSTTTTTNGGEDTPLSSSSSGGGVLLIQDKVEELFSPVVQFLHDHESGIANTDHHHHCDDHHPRVTKSSSSSDDRSMELDFDTATAANTNGHHHIATHYNTDDDEEEEEVFVDAANEEENDDDDASMSRPEAPDYSNTNNQDNEFNPWQFIASLPPYTSVVMHRPPITLPPLIEFPLSSSPTLLQQRAGPSSSLQRKTLVLDLDETLVHCSVTEPADQIVDFTFPVQFHGETYSVHVKCRPYLQQFLNVMCQHFEVIVFTASQKVYADALLNILDPDGKLIHHRLFRESCLAVEGNYLKDLNVLGRDLRRTVLVDNSPHAFGYQVSNGIPIESWFDCPHDRELIKLQRFLLSQVLPAEDVRIPVRNKFQSHILIANAPPFSS